MATNAAVLQPVVMGLLQLTARASGHCWLATVVHRFSLLNLTNKSHCASCRCRFLWRQTEAHSGLFPVVPTIFDKWFEVLFIGQCLCWEGVGLNCIKWVDLKREACSPKGSKGYQKKFISFSARFWMLLERFTVFGASPTWRKPTHLCCNMNSCEAISLLSMSYIKLLMLLVTIILYPCCVASVSQNVFSVKFHSRRPYSGIDTSMLGCSHRSAAYDWSSAVGTVDDNDDDHGNHGDFHHCDP